MSISSDYIKINVVADTLKKAEEEDPPKTLKKVLKPSTKSMK